VLFSVPASVGDGTASMALSLSHDHQRVAFVQSSYATAPEVHAGALGNTRRRGHPINAALKPSVGQGRIGRVEQRRFPRAGLAAVSGRLRREEERIR
jgi:hypothetical protein